MEKKWTAKSLILSLIFPAIILLSLGALGIVLIASGNYSSAYPLLCLISSFVGGALPILLILLTKTDISSFAKEKFVIWFIHPAVFVVGVYMFFYMFLNMFILFLLIIFGLALPVGYYIYKAKGAVKILILSLSDPLLYLLGFFIVFVVEWNLSGGIYIPG